MRRKTGGIRLIRDLTNEDILGWIPWGYTHEDMLCRECASRGITRVARAGCSNVVWRGWPCAVRLAIV